MLQVFTLPEEMTKTRPICSTQSKPRVYFLGKKKLSKNGMIIIIRQKWNDYNNKARALGTIRHTISL